MSADIITIIAQILNGDFNGGDDSEDDSRVNYGWYWISILIFISLGDDDDDDDDSEEYSDEDIEECPDEGMR
jgi:hypothetical protein